MDSVRSVFHYTISVEGTGPEGRLQPRDTSHGLSSNIKALGTVYHERCPMRFSSYVYRQRSREMLPHFSRTLLYTISVEGTGPEGRLQPRDILDRLLSGIEALGTVYHKDTIRDRRLIGPKASPWGKCLSCRQVARKVTDEVVKHPAISPADTPSPIVMGKYKSKCSKTKTIVRIC